MCSYRLAVVIAARMHYWYSLCKRKDFQPERAIKRWEKIQAVVLATLGKVM